MPALSLSDKLCCFGIFVFVFVKENHTVLLMQLHWLRVPVRIEYKLCMLVYRCLHGMALEYLARSFQHISDITTRRHLHSAATSQLVVPATRCLTLCDRAFPVAAAHAWNALPHSVSSASTLLTF